MQTSLARRQRHRRLNNGRYGATGGGTARRAAIAFPLILFGTLIVVGMAGMVGAVAAFSYYSQGLGDPKALLGDLSFDQQTIVYDRTGTVELARLGQQKRELVEFAELPPELIDATTAIEDKTFWENAGFDPVGIVSAGLDTLKGNERGASTITQQLVRARLLPASAFEGSRYERKIKEIIQSVRLTQEYQGKSGKEAIMVAYLNQNFYGNQSYGVKAAARSYFGKELTGLTLAESAILAGIPQSPTAYDLVRNSEVSCDVAIAEGEECPAGKSRLVVPADSAIVVRRNYILDRMKEFSVLSQGMHTAAEYDAAKKEEIVLAPQAAEQWKAPHFVWQVRHELGRILCGEALADACEKVDTGGYRVTTTVDLEMQAKTEKWVYAASRAPNAKDTNAVLKREKIPARDYGWIRNLRGQNIHNAAAAVMDYRTGEILAYVGSARYTDKGNKKFQPQFDVLSDGWRQPGSAIKPINYAIGIDDGRMTASTMFMDVVTDFGRDYTPTQADGLERGPVRLRSALQFSLNIPAIKSGFVNGLDHQFDRSREFGLRYQSSAIPVISMSIGTIELHPIDLLGGYSTIANGGSLMPRRTVSTVVDTAGRTIWPAADSTPQGTQVISPQAAYVVTDILAGNTDSRVNRYWGKWAIFDGDTRRPAAYKTGTTSDNRDVAAYGYLAPPEDPNAPALAVGVWMGNSDNTPNEDRLSLDSSAPLWSRILTDVSSGMPIAEFKEPDGIVHARVDAHSGMLPGAFTARTVEEIFVEGTVPKKADNTKVALDVDAASGLLWQEGCVGPKETKGFLDLGRVEANHESWQRYNRGWINRAKRGSGVRGGPEKTRTSFFYDGAFAPFGRSWGGRFAPTELCPLAPPPTPPPVIICDPVTGICTVVPPVIPPPPDIPVPSVAPAPNGPP